MRTLRNLLTIVIAIFVIGIVSTVCVYRAIPTRNTGLTHFDTIIVLGTPAEDDGTASPEQRERTLEGVREYKAGIAPHLILSGGAAHNRFVEAHVMAILAIAQGVPQSAVFEEGQSRNTIQNIFYSQSIMAANHWNSAEIVSSASHLPRAGLILQRYCFAWRTHAAPWPSEYSPWRRTAHLCVEAEYCLKLKVLGFAPTSFLPSEKGFAYKAKTF